MPARWSGFWILIGWCGWNCWNGWSGWSGWGRSGGYAALHRRGTWFGRLVGETCGEIPQGWAWLLHRWYWFWQIGSGKLRWFSMVNMYSTFHFTIFVNHLILVGYATHTIGSFPSVANLEVRSGGVVSAKIRLPI